MVHVPSPTWSLTDAHCRLPPPPLPTSSLFSLRLVSPSSSSLSFFSPPHPHFLLPPLIQPSGPAVGLLEATWPLCSWSQGVWRAQTPARGKGLMMSCQPVGSRGCYLTGSYESEGLWALAGGAILNSFIPSAFYCPWLLISLRCISRQNIWQTGALHVEALGRRGLSALHM